MRAPTALPPVPRSTMRRFQPTGEYRDFLRNLKSRGCHRFDGLAPATTYRRIRFGVCAAKGTKPQSHFAATSRGYHSHQIETDLCIELTLCSATSPRPEDSPSRRVSVLRSVVLSTISRDPARPEVNDRLGHGLWLRSRVSLRGKNEWGRRDGNYWVEQSGMNLTFRGILGEEAVD